MAQYNGRTVLVTGSRRGVGRIIASHFLAEGAHVVGFARGESSIDHSSYQHIQIDLADPTAIAPAFFLLKKTVKAFDIVVNNAAVLTSQYSIIMSVAAVQSMVNVNLIAPFLVSREAAKTMMLKKEKWGRIINIGSMAASLEPVGDSIYAATKAGISTLANVMAKEFSSLNVTCNTVAISAIDSDMLSQLPREKIEAIIMGLPVQRFAVADDILNVVDFFASNRSSSITAQTIYLGGVN